VRYIRYRAAAKPGIAGAGGEGTVTDFGMRQRNKEYSADPAAGRTEGTVQHKAIVPVETEVTKSGKLISKFFTLDNILHNAQEALDFMDAKGIPSPYPADWAARERELSADVRRYAENHAAGYTGGGKPMKGFPDSGFPAPSPDFVPHQLPADRLAFVNMLMHDAGALEGRRTAKGRAQAIEAQNLAKENQRWLDPATGEVNKLRARMRSAGFDFADRFKSPFEALAAQHILEVGEAPLDMQPGDVPTVRPTGFSGDPGELGRAGIPNPKAVRAGFMPDETRIDTPEFKRWFRDSKVVDENGEPRVVYHGTHAPGFNVFDTRNPKRQTADFNAALGAHFSEKPYVASRFAEGVYDKDNGGVYPVFLNIRNPLMVGSGRPDAKTMAVLRGRIADATKKYDEAARKRTANVDKNALLRLMEEKGMDHPDTQEALNAGEYGKVAEELYRNLNSLIRLSAETEEANRPTREEELAEKSGKSYSDLASLSPAKRLAEGRKLRKALEAMGYDGVLYENASEREGKYTRTWIAFSPEQIKSATGNSGEFDPANPDIRFMPDGGKAGESDIAGENLAREAEEAGITLAPGALIGLMRGDESVKDRIRKRIEEKTGQKARFMPSNDYASEAPLHEFRRGDDRDGFFYHVTTEDRVDPMLYEQGEIKPGQQPQFSTAAPSVNSRGRVFITERDGVIFWADRIAEQIEHSRDLDEDQDAHDFIRVIRIPKKFVHGARLDNESGEYHKGRDFYVRGAIKLSE
jgi:hypothetical protein